jgi:hypothetical protein
MNWLPFLVALAKCWVLLTTYLREKQLLDAGQLEALANLLKAQAGEIDKAIAARKAQAARNATVPKSNSLPNDGYRRD